MSQRSINNLTELRERAQRALELTKASFPEDALRTAENVDMRHLVEELRVYQTELEIQNQELANAQSEVTLTLEKYRSLFDYLPPARPGRRWQRLRRGSRPAGPVNSLE